MRCRLYIDSYEGPKLIITSLVNLLFSCPFNRILLFLVTLRFRILLSLERTSFGTSIIKSFY